jgi:hypothetical protein
MVICVCFRAGLPDRTAWGLISFCYVGIIEDKDGVKISSIKFISKFVKTRVMIWHTQTVLEKIILSTSGELSGLLCKLCEQGSGQRTPF